MVGLKELAMRDHLRHPTIHHNTQVLTTGSTGDRVAILQRVLGQEVTGIMTAEDTMLVIEFQRYHQLVPDGLVGPATWKVVAALYNQLISEEG